MPEYPAMPKTLMCAMPVVRQIGLASEPWAKVLNVPAVLWMEFRLSLPIGDFLDKSPHGAVT